MRRSRAIPPILLALAVAQAGAGPISRACAEAAPSKAEGDRGGGIPASMLGTYIQRGQLLVMPFYEHVSDHNQEYNPGVLGFGPDIDFRGRFDSSSEQVFVAYGFTENLAAEFVASRIRATLHKSPDDPTLMPSRIEESGLDDLEGQVRMRLARERGSRPEIFGFAEIRAPSERNKLLIGNPDWDVRPGVGIVRGFSWGTMTIRSTLEYNREHSALKEPAHVDIGETSVEYLKRLDRAFRLSLAFAGGEGGAPDEWELRSGLQCRLTDAFLLKLDNSVGISSKAPDWTPQIGLMFVKSRK